MAKKSTRKITLEASDKLTIFFKENESNKVFEKLENQFNVTIKINAVGMLVLRGDKDATAKLEKCFNKLKTLKKPIVVEDIYDVLDGKLDFENEEVSGSPMNDFSRIELRNNRSLTVIKAKTKKQEEFINAILTKKVILGMGSPGTGKSFIALAIALKLLETKKIHKIIISKPPIESGPSIGYLPGPQPLTAKILTPNGWTTMGELKIGDYVIAKNGKPSKVLNIYPKGVKKIYDIETTEGGLTKCCIDHLWFTKTAEERKRNKVGKVRTTLEILNSMKSTLPGKKLNGHPPRYGKIRPNHFLPRNDVVDFKEKELSIPPYILGCILGDGSISSNVSLANTDMEMIERVKKELKADGFDCTLNHIKNSISYTFSGNNFNNKPAKRVKITDVSNGNSKEYNSVGVAVQEVNVHKATLGGWCKSRSIRDNFSYEFLDCEVKWTNEIKEGLYKLGLEGTKAATKFIPDSYKYNSAENRIAILQGLMDTDGTVKTSGEASYCTTSKKLALDVVELVRSLGGRATLRSRDRRGESSRLLNGRMIIPREISYEFDISFSNGVNPFYITRKANKFKNRKSLHGEGIISIKESGEAETQCILIDDPEHLYITDDYIVTHNTTEDKMGPYIESVMSILIELVGFEKRTKLIESGVIQIENIGFLRGMTLGNRDSIIYILDEAQNVEFAQHKLILTRLGSQNESRIIMCGDQNQSDLRSKKDTLSKIHSIIKDSPYVGSVVFTKEDVVRSEVVKDLLGRIEQYEEDIANHKK